MSTGRRIAAMAGIAIALSAAGSGIASAAANGNANCVGQVVSGDNADQPGVGGAAVSSVARDGRLGSSVRHC